MRSLAKARFLRKDIEWRYNMKQIRMTCASSMREAISLMGEHFLSTRDSTML